MPSSARVCAMCVLLAAATACSKPEPPPTEHQPEPQAQQAQHTQLRDAIQQPIDKAKAVEQTVQDAADQQRAAIDAAGG